MLAARVDVGVRMCVHVRTHADDDSFRRSSYSYGGHRAAHSPGLGHVAHGPGNDCGAAPRGHHDKTDVNFGIAHLICKSMERIHRQDDQFLGDLEAGYESERVPLDVCDVICWICYAEQHVVFGDGVQRDVLVLQNVVWVDVALVKVQEVLQSHGQVGQVVGPQPRQGDDVGRVLVLLSQKSLLPTALGETVADEQVGDDVHQPDDEFYDPEKDVRVNEVLAHLWSASSTR